MIPPSLPPHLVAALDAKLEGLSRTKAAQRSAAISQTYRAGGTSRGIASADHALAYAVARMPATYAAVAASLNALVAMQPDFAPHSLLDCGAGPGTATIAAAEAFTFDAITMLDANPALRALALDLMDDRGACYLQSDAMSGLRRSQPADLVIASYMINEIAPAQRAALADALWRATADTLLVVEPGTPDGYQRILALRDRLIAQGAHVIAPCPHDAHCSLAPPDWCHFAQRLPRSRAHKHLKGAELAFEDEKFSYVALTRRDVSGPAARVLAKPVVNKFEIAMKLCTSGGHVAVRTVQKRDKNGIAQARRLAWGDAIAR